MADNNKSAQPVEQASQISEEVLKETSGGSKSVAEDIENSAVSKSPEEASAGTRGRLFKYKRELMNNHHDEDR